MARIKKLLQEGGGFDRTAASAGQVELEESDLARGRVDSDSLTGASFKRAATIAQRGAARRGLGLSSISVGEGIGARLDLSKDLAIADSGALVSTAQQNAANLTQASISSAGNQVGLAKQRLSDLAAKERLATQIESTERIGVAERGATRENLATQIASTEGINLARIASTEGIASARNSLDKLLGELKITATQSNLIRQISSTEGMASAQRALDVYLTQTKEAGATGRTLLTIDSTDTNAEAQRVLDQALQNERITATESLQISDILSKEGVAAAKRKLDDLLSIRSEAGALERVSLQITSTDDNSSAQRKLDETLQGDRISAADGLLVKELISKGDIAAAGRLMDKSIAELKETGATGRTELQITSSELLAELDRKNRVLIESMDIEGKLALETLRNTYDIDGDARDSITSAWTFMQQGIATIDIDASPKSQTTQFNRIMDVFKSTAAFLDFDPDTGSGSGGSGPGPGGPGPGSGGDFNIPDSTEGDLNRYLYKGSTEYRT